MRRGAAQGRHHRELIAGILLAAGEARRFGRQKLLESLDGVSLVRGAARRFLEAGLQPVVVVVSPDPRLRKALDGLDVQLVENQAAESGIAGSIALGVSALPASAQAVMIGVADQPHLTAQELSRLMAAHREGGITVARYDDHRGNPAIFDRPFFGELAQLSGDRGGQLVVAAHPEAVLEVSLPPMMGIDIDRPEDWPA
ncbi:MAG TPA: nucleotidyltransferase family protein [Candidatus Dormibacteraeota bacterium]